MKMGVALGLNNPGAVDDNIGIFQKGFQGLPVVEVAGNPFNPRAEVLRAPGDGAHLIPRLDSSLKYMAANKSGGAGEGNQSWLCFGRRHIVSLPCFTQGPDPSQIVYPVYS